MKIEECINFLLTQAQNKVNLLFRKNLEEYGITPAQYMLLNHLWEKDGLAPSQLASLSGLDASTITGLLTRLEKKGLIERRHSTDDRRGVNVFLTSSGADLQPDICRVIEQSNRQALSKLSAAEQQAFRSFLVRLSN